MPDLRYILHLKTAPVAPKAFINNGLFTVLYVAFVLKYGVLLSPLKWPTVFIGFTGSISVCDHALIIQDAKEIFFCESKSVIT